MVAEKLDDFGDLNKWDISAPFAEWADMLRRAGVKSGETDRRMLMISCYPWVTSSMLAYAVLLRKTGCAVDFLWLPYVCGLYSLQEPQLDKQRQEMARIKEIAADIDITPFCLFDYAPEPLPNEWHEAFKDQSYRDYLYTIHADKDINHFDEPLRLFREERNFDTAGRFYGFIRGRTYDVILNVSGKVVEWGVIHFVLDRLGIDHLNIEKGIGRHLFISKNVPILDLKTDGCWEGMRPHSLEPDERRAVEEAMREREDISFWRSDTVSPLQKQAKAGADATRAALGVEADTRIFLLCTTVAWETINLEERHCFVSMLDWVFGAIAFFRERPQVHLIVRVHPAELYISQDVRTYEFICDRFPSLPSNITVISPEDPINTYDLMDVCECGLVYNSTTGLEMAVRGISVINGALVHYSDKDFTWDPRGEDAFYATIDARIDNPSSFKMSERQITSAYVYCYMYFFLMQHPVPWVFQKLWKEIDICSMESLIVENKIADFKKTFDMLSHPFDRYEGLISKR